tara:strand:- start:2781 stop:3413 length:633 start_codon:yes stop_codon:yes gene_type:complete
MSNVQILKSAQTHLQKVDPTMLGLIRTIGDINLRTREPNFESLVRIIVNQQLSNKAANTIFERVKDACSCSPLTPQNILNLESKDFRKCGLSNSKTIFVKNLAELCENKPNFLAELNSLPTQQAHKELIKIKGIGVWTANIFLMFCLGREDIFPYGDVTLTKALNILYGIKLDRRIPQEDPTIERWSPFRSVAALYLWEWIDRGMPQIIR